MLNRRREPTNSPMTPRRRPRVGLTRLDAALDAMRPLGFADDVVRQSVKDLLKVYGGDSGWGFIEEAAYKLLIDTILEQQEEAEKEDSESENEQEEQVEQNNEPIEQVNDNYQPQGVDGEATVYEDEEFEDLACLSTQDNVYSGEVGDSVSCVAGGSSTTWDEGSTKRRKPCYGWISDSDDDEFVFFELAKDGFSK